MTDERTELKTVEELAIDQTWDVGQVTITEAEILSFAQQYDPQPFHVDPEAGKRHFDGLIASGWHTAAACMRPFATEVLSEVAIVAALGIDDLRWHAPVQPGDTLSVAVTVRDKEPWNEHRGKVTFGLVATNQDGETVHTRKDLVLVERADDSGD
jgi:acyl dehydratase